MQWWQTFLLYVYIFSCKQPFCILKFKFNLSIETKDLWNFSACQKEWEILFSLRFVLNTKLESVFTLFLKTYTKGSNVYWNYQNLLHHLSTPRTIAFRRSSPGSQYHEFEIMTIISILLLWNWCANFSFHTWICAERNDWYKWIQICWKSHAC